MRQGSPSDVLEKSYKRGFAVKFLALCALGFFGAAGGLYIALSRDLGKSYAEAFFTFERVKELGSTAIYLGITLQLLAVSLGFLVVALLVSHKIAGPLFRLERVFQSLREGDLSIVTRLRAKDQITKIADQLNDTTHQLAEDLREILHRHQDLVHIEEALESLLGATPLEEERIKAMAHQIHRQAKEIQEILAGFKTSSATPGADELSPEA